MNDKILGFIDKYFVKKPLFRKFFTKAVYGDKNIFVNFFNTQLYINTVKENGYLRAFNYSRNNSVFKDEVSILINLASFITHDTTFIDAGANVGLFSSTFQRFQKLYPGINIYAFEANPDTFARLSKTAENTGIRIFNVALSNQETVLEFVEGVVSHVFAEKTYLRPYHLKNSKMIRIQAKKLDQYDLKGDSIILKIDVEGHEYEVLEGAKKLFESRRVKLVYIDGFQKREEVIAFLKSFAFKLLDGKTLEPSNEYNFSLLALRQDINIY